MKQEENTNKLVCELVDELVKERKSQNISQRELAIRLGSVQPAVYKIEKKRRIPRLDTFVRIANELGYSVSLEPFRKENI